MNSFRVLQIDEPVVKDDVFLDSILLGQNLEAQPISFTVLAHFVWMCRAEDYVHDVGKLSHDRRQRI